MKRLVFLRHAKSSWEDRLLNDDLRPLNKRGKDDCKLVGNQLRELNFDTEIALVSPAQRAQSTARKVLACCDADIDLQTMDALYTFDSRKLLREIRLFEHRYNDLLIVGDNPAFTELVNELAVEDIDNLPTCAVAELICDVSSWGDVKDGCAELVSMITPKMLRSKKPKHTSDWVRD